MIKFLKSLILTIFILLIIGGIVFSIYYFSPEIKPGQIGVVYKIYGKEKGFTGKILSSGKYYYFLSGLIPGIYKIYKIDIKPEYKQYHIKLFDGSEINLELVYEIDKKNIDNYLKNLNNSEIDKILNIYIKSAIDDIFLNFSIYDMVRDDFNKIFEENIINVLNKELSFFGLRLKKIKPIKIIFSEEKRKVIDKIKENKIALEKLKIDTDNRLKEERIKNKLKIERLNFLLKKAEIEKEIAKKKVEKINIYWEAQKKRLKEEVEILSKPGGDLATKLESVRMLVNGLKSSDKIEKSSNLVNKILK